MKRRLFFLFVILTLMMGMQTVSATELATGLKEPEVIAVPERVISEDVINPDRLSETENADAETDKWNAYSSKYYYNQLDEEYKEVWDALDVVCKSYFDGSRNVSGYTDSVSLPEGTTLDELQVFWRLYIFSNPQYYFLKNGFSYSFRNDNQKPVSVKLGIYQAFYNGEDRAEATAKVEDQLASWQAEIDACTTDAAKLQKIQDLICAKVTYNNDAANGRVDEEISFSQSPYSVFCGDSTVCAGYADTFYMLCNVSGIDAISVTSPGHQWNKARVNGSWYNFDPTWDDTYTESRGYPVYRYHGRSDAMYDVDMNSGSSSNIQNHQEEEFWNNYIPDCNLDSNPTGDCSIPGVFATASGQVATPVIVFTYENSKIKAAMSCETIGASIYYTTDGTKPAVAETKSLKYNGAFVVDENTRIRAVAIKDSYTDSVIAERVAELEKYAITYVLDGGENHAENPENYTIRDSFTLQAPSKPGYIFEGWYCDEAYDEKVTEVEKGTEGPLAFYAKWIPISYNIAFNGNEATSGSMVPLTSCIYDREYTLSQQGYEREGYVFAGWNTEADGSGIAYADEESVKNLMTEEGATVTLYAQWNPIVYTICFDGNGAEEGEMSAVADCEYNEEVSLPANAYTRTGRVFAGWNTEADGSGDSYADGETVKNLTTQAGATVTLYAQWQGITYTIVFDGNGATGGSMESQADCEYNSSYELAANNYVKSGYVYVGWNTKADGGGISYEAGTLVENLATTDGAEVILYAQWAPIFYTISFDGNMADDGVMDDVENCAYDTAYELPANDFEKTGYVFAGWNTEADGNGISYEDVAPVENLATIDGAEVILYAQWAPIFYTISFDGNTANGGVMDDMENCAYDTSYILTANSFEKTGYILAGWNAEADGSGESYADGEAVKNLTAQPGTTVTLYAQWQLITYTIVFEGNGATGGSMESQADCEYNENYELAANNYVRTGYTYAGWNTAADGNGVSYEDGAPVKNLTTTDGAEVILYAQWAPITYTISFDGNTADGGVMDDMENCSYDRAYELTVNSYEKSGYMFAGWTTGADASAVIYVDRETVKNLTVEDGAEVILYAQWKPISYKVIFDGNGATGGDAEVLICKYDSSYELTVNSYRKTGYMFTGWNTKADGGGNSYTDQEKVKNLLTEDGAEFVLYAQWKPITYTVSFDGNGATGGETESLICNYDGSYEILANGYEKNGYTFTGWNSEKDGSGTYYAEGVSVKNLSATDDATITLYAQWTADIYNVVFDGNGATDGKMSAMTNLSRGKSYELSTNGYICTGYVFVGWNTKADGSGDSYVDGAQIYNPDTRNTDTVSLYAQWSPIVYKVSFDGNGATDGVTESLTACEFDSDYELTVNGFVRNGYIFAGWNTKADGSGTAYSEKEEIRNLATNADVTVTLYAQWSPIVYNVSFDGNGATSGVTASLIECKYDSSYALSSNGFVRTGYRFTGWNTSADGSGTDYSDKEEIKNLTTNADATVTLYAQWKSIVYKVSFDGNGATSGVTASLIECKYDSSYVLTANSFVKTGYTFTGWNTKADGSGTAYANKAAVKNLTTTEGAVITLYAQWKTNSYTIKFDGNKAGKGSMYSMTSLLYGKSYGLASNKYKRTGYRFVGWNTAKNGKGVAVKNKATIQNLSTKDGGVVVLYAQWKANKYSVKFHGNGATSGSMKKMKNRTYDKKFKLSANKFKREGYKFIGWNTKKNGKGKMYKNKAKVKNLTSKNGKTVTLYAQWKKL